MAIDPDVLALQNWENDGGALLTDAELYGTEPTQFRMESTNLEPVCIPALKNARVEESDNKEDLLTQRVNSPEPNVARILENHI